MMKRLSLLAFAVLLAVGFSGRAHALAYSDFQGTNVYFGNPLFTSGVNSHTWTFDLDNDVLAVGDVNPGDVINSASLYIGVLASDFLPEFAALVLDGIPVFVGEIDTAVYNLNVFAWVADHVLNVEIVRILGDFTIDYVQLAGDYTPGNNGGPNEPTVPEPATMALGMMGLSLAGLVRRRKAAKA